MVSFVNLIRLLSKHQLYISESGLIARYGKTKGQETTRNQNRLQLIQENIEQFFYGNAFSLLWILLYICLNLLIFSIGVAVYHNDKYESTWALFAFGCGPVLSMNCVLILLPTLSSLIHAMRNSIWMTKVGCV